MQVNTHISRKKTPIPTAIHTAIPARNGTDVQSYFEYAKAGIDVVEEGLTEVTFGEFLVDQGILDRFQLFRALQMQDRLPGVRLGECAAALGYAPIAVIEKLYERFQEVSAVEVG
jgi:hypothetical protein